MELEEAIKTMEEFLKDTPRLPYDCIANQEIIAVETLLNHLTKQEKMIKEYEEMIIRHKEQLRKAGIYGYDYDLKVLTEEGE